MTRRIRHSKKTMIRAIASSPSAPVIPSTKTRSRANEHMMISASNTWVRDKRKVSELRRWYCSSRKNVAWLRIWNIIYWRNLFYPFCELQSIGLVGPYVRNDFCYIEWTIGWLTNCILITLKTILCFSILDDSRNNFELIKSTRSFNKLT